MIKSYSYKHKKNKIEHNKAILKEIRNRIMIEIWSIIPTSLAHGGIMTENVIMHGIQL